MLLAQTLTSFLAPALPYLLKTGETAAAEAGKKLGAGVVEKANELWAKLVPAVEARPAAKETAEDVAKAPDDAVAQTALQHQLRKILAQDESLAEAVAKLLEKAGDKTSYHAELHGDGAIAQGPGAVAAGKGGVAVGGDVQGSVVVGAGGKQRG
ncbi:MAG: hypothetical protein GY856_20140 [bacterium]|nr:hypothetical protein [bacterium]